MREKAGIDTWLLRALLACGVLFLLMSCFMTWRISMAVYRAEQMIVKVSAKLDRVEQKVEQIRNRAAPAVRTGLHTGRELLSDPRVQAWLRTKVGLDQPTTRPHPDE